MKNVQEKLLMEFFLLLFRTTPEVETTSMKFMCDMCESNWLHCLIKCNMEEYMTRHNYE
jgi:hypothetical protein